MSEGYEAPLYSAGEPQSASDFQIYTRYHAESDPPHAKVEDILRRHGVEASAGYTHHGILVGAALDVGQLAAIRGDPQVAWIERDCIDHVARYFRMPAAIRIDGSYIVAAVSAPDAAGLVARHGISSATMLDAFSSFGAQLSDEQRDRLRHEPTVRYLQDDSMDYLAAE